MKLRLIRLRIRRRNDKRKQWNERMSQKRSQVTKKYNEALLRMMADRYTVQKERAMFDEQWSSNERHRYERFAFILSIVTEECASLHIATCKSGTI